MSAYKLYYFDGRGKAELIRLILTVGGVQFEDIRVSDDDWPALKPTFQWEYMPVLEIDGKQYGENKAIARMMARQFGIAGQNPAEQCLADAVIDVCDEILDFFYHIQFHYDDEHVKKTLKPQYLERIEKGIDNLQKLLCSNNGGDGYFIGDQLTWADLSVFVMCEHVASQWCADKLKSSPKLAALIERVRNQEKLKAYLADPKRNTSF